MPDDTPREAAAASPATAPARRLPPVHSRFRPGQSGNPSGTPRATIELRRLAQAHGPAAIAALAEIMVNKRNSPQARATAAQALLDRGYGRPVQPVDLEARPLADVPTDVLLRLVQELSGMIQGGEALPARFLEMRAEADDDGR
jgi:hypothetical protein